MKFLLLFISLFVGLFAGSTAQAKDRNGVLLSVPTLHIEASSIHLGVKRPGMFSPGNLYDGAMSTSYCGAPGEMARVSFIAPMSGLDEEKLRQITHVKIVGGPSAAVSRTVTIRISYIPGSGQHKFESVSTLLAASESITLPVNLPKNAIAIDVQVSIAPYKGSKRKQVMCLGEVVFQRDSKVTSLSELAAAAHQESALYESLATAKTRQALTGNYLTGHRWIRFHPDKNKVAMRPRQAY